MNLVESNASFVAIDTGNNNRVVGIALNHDYNKYKEFGKNFKQIANKYNQMDIYKTNHYMTKLKPF